MFKNKIDRLTLYTLILSVGIVYLQTQVKSIYGGDAGDLAVAIKTIGIAHPPGYPLYTILGIILNTLIPMGTLAWRVGFVSLISSIIALFYLYRLIYLLTEKSFISFITVATVAFLYPIWLYSVVVEVFALNNMFLAVLLYYSFLFAKNNNIRDFYLLSYLFGLSLSHHHIIIFILPVIILLVYKNKRSIKLRNIIISSLLIFSGLIPYFYLWLSSMFNPALNWQGPPTFINFWNVLTRAGYGTFTAGKFIANVPILRFLSLWGFFDFVYKDFRILGLILIFSGIYISFKWYKKYSFPLIFGLLSYIFFLFYASFPLSENFMVGTFERFIQPLYLILGIYLSFGLVLFMKIFEKVINNLITFPNRFVVLRLISCLFLIYPLGMLILNYPKISILKNDFTAENLGRDILNSVEKEAILIISTDTPLFDTQYVYWSENKWRQVKLIHLSKLWTSFYSTQLSKLYPEIELADEGVDAENQFKSFIRKNYGKYPIYSKQSFKSDEGIWVPYGLLFRYYKNADLPSDGDLLSLNEKLWTGYHDPLASSLSSYQNLMLADVLRTYAFARQEIGFWEAKKGFVYQAEKHLLEGKRLYPDDLDSNIILAQVYIIEKRCEEAKKESEEVIAANKDNADSFLVMSINYAVCFKDEVKAREYQSLYESKRRGQETELRLL